MSAVDQFGNEFKEVWGRSRRVTHEQFMNILARDHAERGCCTPPPEPVSQTDYKYGDVHDDSGEGS